MTKKQKEIKTGLVLEKVELKEGYYTYVLRNYDTHNSKRKKLIGSKTIYEIYEEEKKKGTDNNETETIKSSIVC